MRGTLLSWWVIFGVVVTLLSGMVYGAGQYILRADANDPQVQMAEDRAVALTGGTPIDIVIPKTMVDMANSLSPFVIVADENGKLVASSATLDGEKPVPPAGVFMYSKEHGENRVTWQPQPGVRVAVVVKPYHTGNKGGFVLAGRSLREVEERKSALGLRVALGWLFSLVVTGATVALLTKKKI